MSFASSHIIPAFQSSARKAWHPTTCTPLTPRRASELVGGVQHPNPSSVVPAGAHSCSVAVEVASGLGVGLIRADVSNDSQHEELGCPDEMPGQLEHCRARNFGASTLHTSRTSIS